MNKYLIITPKFGLCNQLLSISRGIILGIITNRNIIFKSFQLDYRNMDNVTAFDDIIDISHLKNILTSKKVMIDIISQNMTGKKVVTNNQEEEICYIKDFIPILFYNCNINETYLDIENPISYYIPNQYNKLYNFINQNIQFTEKYIKIADNIKKKLNLIQYSVIHLRLEDDSIHFLKDNSDKSFEEINKIYIEKYIKELDIIKNKDNDIPIYICTSLAINENVNNSFYKKLKSKYNLIDKNDYTEIIDKNNSREIYGIIDYIIAKDGIYFVGSDWSSFSIYLNDYYKNNNKASLLIDIWQSIYLS
jgi:hypothetical protein